MPARFIGVDGEMTGTDGPAVHQLIQIGVATSPDEVFVSNIGFDAWQENVESMQVHGLSPELIRSAPRPDDVDAALCGWLADKVVGAERGLNPGWVERRGLRSALRSSLPPEVLHSSQSSQRRSQRGLLHGGRHRRIEVEDPQEAIEALRRGETWAELTGTKRATPLPLLCSPGSTSRCWREGTSPHSTLLPGALLVDQ